MKMLHFAGCTALLAGCWGGLEKSLSVGRIKPVSNFNQRDALDEKITNSNIANIAPQSMERTHKENIDVGGTELLRPNFYMGPIRTKYKFSPPPQKKKF